MDITDFTGGADTYASRRRVNKAQYRGVLEELRKFASARAEGKHTLGVAWFRNEGMRLLNQRRTENGETPHAMLCEAALMKWLADNHPELREVFRR